MGRQRHLNRNDSSFQFNKYYRGCIWGLLPLHFHSFKKLMPHIRHNKDERSSKSGLKSESKENTRPDISIHISKEHNPSKGQVSQQPKLQRTFSIHHLEPLSDHLYGLNVDHEQPILVRKISKALPDTDQELWNSKQFGEQDVLVHDPTDKYQFSSESDSSSETFEDFFDAFQIDKKLFMKNTQKLDTDDSDNNQGILKSHRKFTLKKSGSFPAGNRSCIRFGSLTPSKLESKLTEVWPSSSFSSSSTSSSSSLFQSSETILPRSQSIVCNSLPDIFGEVTLEKSSHDENEHRTGDYAADVRKYKLSRVRRASSLKESLERYTQLFETSFRRDVKLNVSKSLRLSNEYEDGFILSDSVFLRKVHSMCEALQIDPSDSIEFHKVPNESATFITESCPDKQSETEVSEDEPCADLEQVLLDEVQTALDSQKHLDAEDTEAADVNLDDFPQDDDTLGTEDSIEFSYERNDLNQLGILGRRLSKQKSTELNIGLDDQLLSDLVNETLLNIYDGCDAYWPAPLCSNRHMHPPPRTGQQILQKVQLSIERLQSLSLKSSNITDSVTAYDLAHNDGWMNLQADAESLGLALDEMIFDELIEELVYEYRYKF